MLGYVCSAFRELQISLGTGEEGSGAVGITKKRAIQQEEMSTVKMGRMKDLWGERILSKGGEEKRAKRGG
jgi:hypothetical protein